MIVLSPGNLILKLRWDITKKELGTAEISCKWRCNSAT